MKRIVFGLILIVGMLLATAGSGVGLAQYAEGTLSATPVEDECMEDLAGFDLVCTANDVRLATATDIIITDPCDYPGDSVTFTAKFEVLLTAQARHDIGIYFARDGDPNGDGAVSGLCTIATLPYFPDPPWLDLDGFDDLVPGTKTVSNLQDVCGDIDGTHNPLFPEVTITAICDDTNGNGWLDLPYCTSWRQSGANEYCAGPTSAYPGAPSKCKCDTAYEVEVPVPSATIDVEKTPSMAVVDEPGAVVRFTVVITNTGSDPLNPVTLDSLVDDKFGDITYVHDKITSTTCGLTTPIPGNMGTYGCYFDAFVGGDAGFVHTDTVEADGHDSRTPPNGVEGSDDATVEIKDVAPSITVDKSANPESMDEPGGDVEFTVVVTNNSFEDVTLTSLNDDIYGDLSLRGCVLGGTIAADGGTYTCKFTVDLTKEPGFYTDRVTAVATDNDGSSDEKKDDATVEIKDVLPTAHLTKTPTKVVVTFEVVIYNDSTASSDPLTVDDLNDDVYGEIWNTSNDAIESTTCNLAIGQVIQPGKSYACSFTAEVLPDHKNTVTADVTDDEGTLLQPSDSAWVDFEDVMY